MTAVWYPKNPESTQMAQFSRFIAEKYQTTFNNYHDLHQWTINHIEEFWASLCEYFAIHFTTPPVRVLSSQALITAHWFEGATFNVAEQLLKRHDNHPALICINENNERFVLTYAELQQQVANCAAGLMKLGVEAGDRVAAILPNVHFTVIAMLACASIGAIWSSCSPDFGISAASDRFAQIEPKILFIANGYHYLGKHYKSGEKATSFAEMIPSIQAVIVCPIINTPFQPQEKTYSWASLLQANSTFAPKALDFSHPLYILFSSGTTGKPKCIVHSAGGTFLQHIKELALHTNLDATDNFFFYTTCGWMMWNWMISGLALGTSIVLYDGAPSYPDISRLFQLIEDENITVFGTSAKFLSSVEKSGFKPIERYTFKALRTILSTGSPLLPKNYDFVYQDINASVQLSSISGGTDIISCFALGNPISPVYRGELQCLGLGMAVDVYDSQGQSLIGQQGELVCTKPFPSMPLGFWNDLNNVKFTNTYFSQYPLAWSQGDFAELTAHQGLIIYGRSDTVLNPGGIRIGTAEIYRQLETIAEIIDSVVVSQHWEDDERIILFVKLKQELTLNEELAQTIRQVLRTQASPRHVPAKILQVPDIPRTLSGKTSEVAVRQVIHGKAVNNLDSLANPEALTFFKNRAELNY